MRSSRSLIITIALLLAAPPAGIEAAIDRSDPITSMITVARRVPPLPAARAADGVDITAGSVEDLARAIDALATYAEAGYDLGPLSIRMYDSEADCDGNAGVHRVADGRHIIDVCSDATHVLRHELGHVWAARALCPADRVGWLELRGLDSWSEGEWRDRGTEHVAEIVAFGVDGKQYSPRRISNNDYAEIVEAYDWLEDRARQVCERVDA